MRKISAMNTDELMDFLLVMTPEIGEILQDQEIVQIFKSKKKANENHALFILGKLTEAVPLIIKKHKQAVYVMLSSVSEIPVEDIKKQNGVETLSQIIAIFNDQDLKNFFM